MLDYATVAAGRRGCSAAVPLGGGAIPALRSLNDDRVIYLGSFEVLFPGRLGYAVRRLRDDLIAAR
jgi:hypothetical protein